MQADNITRALLGSILVCGLVIVGQGLGSGEAAMEPAAPAPAEDMRFEVTPVPRRNASVLLVRLDTVTGQTWEMGALDEGLWKSFAEGPEGVPSPDASEPGRYSLVAVGQRRGAPTLVRTDHRTGRIWRVATTNQGPWVPVPNPSGASAATAESPSQDDPAGR